MGSGTIGRESEGFAPGRAVARAGHRGGRVRGVVSLSDDMRRQATPDVWIAALAERQGGAVARHQLVSRGLSARSIDRRIANGRLHVLYRGVYAIGHRRIGIVGWRWA